MYTLPSANATTRLPAPIRSSGRQTLGSSHDSPPDGSRAGDNKAGARPTTDGTLPVWWRIFVDHCATFDIEERRTANRLIGHVEVGWAHLTQLQFECERQHAARGASPDNRVAHLIGYIETEVVGSFLECAEQTARYFSETDESGAGLDALCRVAHRFERAVALCALASESAYLTGAFKGTLQQVANALLDWSADFDALTSAMVRHRSPDSSVSD
jgi:hypothetical protein